MISEILQPTHLVFLLLAVLLFLGPKRLPAAGRSLGQGLREFKNSLAGGHDDGTRAPAIPDIQDDTATPSDVRS
ncbi:MAG TPA: twin-arginine translocase TatA/TatE family subunit [Solirubrobacteraceae bacterium]|jgi:sec-independent protein translocase protein TatA